MSDHATKLNRALDYLGDLSFEASQVSVEMTDKEAADHGVHAVRIARLASLIIAMDDKKLEALLRGAGETGAATAMFRRLADSFASEAILHEERATIMNDACGRLLVVMDRISIADAADDDASDGHTDPFGEETAVSVGQSSDDEIVVELDRGLRSAALASANSVLEDSGGSPASPPAKDPL